VRIRQHHQTIVVAVITAIVTAAVPAVAHVTESWKHLRNKHVRPFTDKRYFTKTVLQTADAAVNESGDPVDWTKLKGVPVGFADGVDDAGGTASDLDCPGCVEASDLAPDAVTSAKILDGEVAIADLAFDPATQGELDALGTAGSINDAGNPVHWTKLKGVPAGLADGTDDGVTTGTDGVAVSGMMAQLADCTTTGQIFKYNAVTNTWSCSSDSDTTYTGSQGIAIIGTDIRLDDCAADEVWKRNSADTAWECAAQPAVGSGAYASGTVTSTAGTKASAIVTFPSDGFAVVMSQAQFNRAAVNITNYLAVELREAAMTLDSWRWDPGDSDAIEDARQTQASVVPVTSGTHTFDLVIATDADSVSYAKANLVVVFFPTSL
jgi:hypothetical protein